FDELHERAVEHRSTPDDGRFGILEQESDAHQLDAEARERLDRFSVERDRTARHAHHRRNRRAVDVGVEKAYAMTRSRERHREVRRDRALSDAAFSTHHEDDVAHVGKRIVGTDFSAAHFAHPLYFYAGHIFYRERCFANGRPELFARTLHFHRDRHRAAVD